YARGQRSAHSATPAPVWLRAGADAGGQQRDTGGTSGEYQWPYWLRDLCCNGYYAIIGKAGIQVNRQTGKGSLMGTHGTRRHFITSVGAAAAVIQTFEPLAPYGVLAADTENLKEIVRPFYTDCLTVSTHADVV